MASKYNQDAENALKKGLEKKEKEKSKKKEKEFEQLKEDVKGLHQKMDLIIDLLTNKFK